jgi:hypothetical protein
MQIQLKDGWEATGASSTISRTVRTSFLLINVIDETLDKMHAQGRLEWTQKPVPYAFPVFVEWRVVYKDGKPIRKGRAVVDIRGLSPAAV